MKKIVSLIFALSVLFVFAEASNVFSGQPLSVCAANEPSSSILSNGYKVYDQYTSQDHNTLSLSMYAMSTVENTYCFSVDTSLYACSKFSGGKIRMAYSSNSSPTTYNISNFDSDSGYYFISIGSNSGANYLVFNAPSFESLSDGFSYIDNLSDVVDSSFSLPAGNVAYMIVPSGGTFSLSCVQNEFSSWSSPYWPRTGQTISYSSSLPTSNTTFPLSGASDINWSKGGNPNILGQTKNAIYSGTSSSINYLVVYNPLYNASEDVYHDRVLPNGDITITANNLLYIRIFPLTATLSGDSVAGFNNSSYSGSSFEDYYVGDIQDDGTITWMNQNGEATSPHIGGESYLPEEITVSGFLNKVVSILEDVVSSLGKIFGFAYEAIVSLVGLASNFVTVLGSLYSWLPSPLYSVLISAITLAITIGVFKVFL